MSPIPSKPPFNLSQVKAETGQSSMAHAAVALGMAKLVGADLQPDIKCSQFAGKALGNFQATIARSDDSGAPGYTTYNSYQTIYDAVGAGFYMITAQKQPGNAYESQIYTQNSTAKTFTAYCYGNGKTYTFTKQQADLYHVTGAPAQELFNLFAANLNKVMKFRITHA
ncbi:hypothetical protein K6R49_003742 [Escherichia coli]|nr:hypothetical protein [Escherichia coli]MBJ0329710.1 hypothetical protein [Escherichia coli]